MGGKIEYIARRGNVWKHSQTGAVFSDKITLKNKENINDYVQIRSKDAKTEKEKTAGKANKLPAANSSVNIPVDENKEDISI
jgi:hypothetical protein